MSRKSISADSLRRRSLALEVRTLPDAARAAVADLLPQVLSVLPHEITSLTVEYDQAGTADLQAKVHANYDTLTIRLMPRWLAKPRQQQRHDLCHEIAHAWLCRLRCIQGNVNDAWVKDDEARAFVDRTLDNEEERLVERLGELLAEASIVLPPVEVTP